MVLGIIARLSSNVCCFLYPAYASYKALSMSPESSPEAMAQVEKWLMYWAVVGTWTAVEAVIGWTFTWLPFYSVVKALVFVYLSSPQSDGSAYIYRTQLAPFFHEHERDIDAFLASLKGRASTALAGGFGWIWNKAKTQLNVQVPPGGGSNQPAVGTQQPPTFQEPASGAAVQVYGFLSRYAGQYMPVALSALSAATSSARARGDRDATPVATQVPESMSMPIPRINSGDPNASLRSRTYQHADVSNPNMYGDQYGQYPSQTEGWSRGPLPTPPSFSNHPSYSSNSPHRGPMPLPGDNRGSFDRLSAHSSQESLGTRSSGSTSATRFAGESYEHVRRDEIVDTQAALGQGTPTGRPGGSDRRRSSWFGWGGGTPTQAKPKGE